MKLFGRKNKKENENEAPKDAVLTLYACRKDGSAAAEIARRQFADVMERLFYPDENEFVILFKDGTSVQFHVMDNTQETKAQSTGMTNFFAQAPLENEEVKRAVLRQISLFNCIVGITFQLDGNEQRTSFILHAIYQMAQELTAFVLHPNMYLYKPDGKLLISIDGKTDFDEFYPLGSSDILEREAREMEADRERKARSIAILKERNIPYIEHLKAAVYESECRIPDKEEIIHRLSAVFGAAVTAEAYGSGCENPEETAGKMTATLEELYGISEWMSAEEKSYMENPVPSLHSKFGWRYECCSVLLWALSLMELEEPDQICDASELGAIMWKNDFDSLMKKSVLRSKEELLDMQDLVYRYDWACVDARIHHKELSGLDGEIIVEWHYALNWLTGADGITDWDKVVTTT